MVILETFISLYIVFICINNSCILKCFRSKGGFERMNKEKKRQKDKEDLEMISNVQGKLLNGYHE